MIARLCFFVGSTDYFVAKILEKQIKNSTFVGINSDLGEFDTDNKPKKTIQ